MTCLKGFQNIPTGEIERTMDINLKHRGEISAEGKLANLWYICGKYYCVLGRDYLERESESIRVNCEALGGCREDNYSLNVIVNNNNKRGNVTTSEERWV